MCAGRVDGGGVRLAGRRARDHRDRLHPAWPCHLLDRDDDRRDQGHDAQRRWADAERQFQAGNGNNTMQWADGVGVVIAGNGNKITASNGADTVQRGQVKRAPKHRPLR